MMSSGAKSILIQTSVCVGIKLALHKRNRCVATCGHLLVAMSGTPEQLRVMEMRSEVTCTTVAHSACDVSQYLLELDICGTYQNLQHFSATVMCLKSILHIEVYILSYCLRCLLRILQTASLSAAAAGVRVPYSRGHWH